MDISRFNIRYIKKKNGEPSYEKKCKNCIGKEKRKRIKSNPICYEKQKEYDRLYSYKSGRNKGTRKDYLQRLRQEGLNNLALDDKDCKKCKTRKPLYEFGKAYANTDGHKGICRDCSRKSLVKKICPICQIEFESNNKKYCNNECYKKSRRSKYQNDREYRERKKLAVKLSHQRDRSLMLARKHKREAIMLHQHDGTVDAKTINNILYERKVCPYCGMRLTDKNRSMDHLDPLSKGGLHTRSNLIVCCLSCNLKKHDKTYSEWIKDLQQSNKLKAIRLYERKQGRPIEQGALCFIFN